MTEMRAVLVTGATGFLGGHVCGTLLQRGVVVRGAVWSDGLALVPGVQPVALRDLDDRESLRRALVGVDTVVHLAARVHVMNDAAADPLREFRRVNVEGTGTVLEEAIAAGVTRFAFVSSVKAVGEASVVPWTEVTPPVPVDPYGISKLEAEQLVRQLATAHGVHAPILRLPLCYGPGMKGNMLRLFALVDRGVPLPLGGVSNRRSLVYVGNVADALVAVLDTPQAAAETFFVSDGQDLSTPDLVRAIARALGRPARLIPVPPLLFQLAGRFGDFASGYLPFPVSSAAVDRLLGSLVVDSSKLTRVTGFRPTHRVEDGLRATADWFRSERGKQQ
jgi:nucleoside-diphosphate-sugar epimerase